MRLDRKNKEKTRSYKGSSRFRKGIPGDERVPSCASPAVYEWFGPPMSSTTPAFFHPDQLAFKPAYEWAFGERIDHPETTARAEAIRASLIDLPGIDLRPPNRMPIEAIEALHDEELLMVYRRAAALEAGETLYPHVFPKLQRGKGDPSNLHMAGAWCFDAGTPLTRNTWTAAAWSAACAQEAAKAVLEEKVPMAYALSRPPGHHAQADLFGGYCYFNNAAIATETLRPHGKVAILDIDFHHGNGTQSLYYGSDEVFVCSIHGDPTEFFPFHCGYADERGEGAGEGYNLNLCLPAGTRGEAYGHLLTKVALEAIRSFGPDFLVLSAGFDGYEKDPVGGWELTTDDFETLGGILAGMGLPVVVVQEGGYYTPDLGTNAAALLTGLRR
tara:strand:+ start:2113 stop:3270 length:1158 start_codon:yes stop_codon:yes gene_type:complete